MPRKRKPLIKHFKIAEAKIRKEGRGQVESERRLEEEPVSENVPLPDNMFELEEESGSKQVSIQTSVQLTEEGTLLPGCADGTTTLINASDQVTAYGTTGDQGNSQQQLPFLMQHSKPPHLQQVLQQQDSIQPPFTRMVLKSVPLAGQALPAGIGQVAGPIVLNAQHPPLPIQSVEPSHLQQVLQHQQQPSKLAHQPIQPPFTEMVLEQSPHTGQALPAGISEVDETASESPQLIAYKPGSLDI